MPGSLQAAANSAEVQEALEQKATTIAADEGAGASEKPVADAHSAIWITFSEWFPQAAHFVDSPYFSMLVKAMCMGGNILVQISPWPQVMRWESRGCTGEADPAPYVSIAFGGCQWCFYGIFAWMLTKRSGFLILVQSNFLGALLGTYYAVTFYRNCQSEKMLDSLQRYLSAATTLALLQLCAIIVLPAERSLFLTGCLSSFCGFVSAASMLVSIPKVLRTKDSSLIPGPFIWASLISSLVWCLCGWILDDPLVVGPNIFAIFASLVNLCLKWTYPSIEEAKQSPAGDGVLGAALMFAKDAVLSGRPNSSGLLPHTWSSRSQKGSRKERPDSALHPSELTPLMTEVQAEQQTASLTPQAAVVPAEPVEPTTPAERPTPRAPERQALTTGQTQGFRRMSDGGTGGMFNTM